MNDRPARVAMVVGIKMTNRPIVVLVRLVSSFFDLPERAATQMQHVGGGAKGKIADGNPTTVERMLEGLPRRASVLKRDDTPPPNLLRIQQERTDMRVALGQGDMHVALGQADMRVALGQAVVGLEFPGNARSALPQSGKRMIDDLWSEDDGV